MSNLGPVSRHCDNGIQAKSWLDVGIGSRIYMISMDDPYSWSVLGGALDPAWYTRSMIFKSVDGSYILRWIRNPLDHQDCIETGAILLWGGAGSNSTDPSRAWACASFQDANVYPEALPRFERLKCTME